MRRFQVAMSFPGELRTVVKQIVDILKEAGISVFYDNDFVDELARPELDTHLQTIYRDQADLIVVFLGSEYERKPWCGLEWRTIRTLIFKREPERIFLIKADDGPVTGIEPTDGYVDLLKYAPKAIAQMIQRRLGHDPVVAKPVSEGGGQATEGTKVDRGDETQIRGGGQREMIRIKLHIVRNGDVHPLDVAVDAVVDAVIEGMVRRFGIPTRYDGGWTVSWALQDRTGRNLDAQKTLRENGVNAGDTFNLVSRPVRAG